MWQLHQLDWVKLQNSVVTAKKPNKGSSSRYLQLKRVNPDVPSTAAESLTRSKQTQVNPSQTDMKYMFIYRKQDPNAGMLRQHGFTKVSDHDGEIAPVTKESVKKKKNSLSNYPVLSA